MFSILSLCLALIGRQGINPPTQPGQEIPGLSRMYENFHREYMDIVRRGISLVEGEIASDERYLREAADRLTPDRVARVRKGIQELREELVKMKQWERELLRSDFQRWQDPNTALAEIERLERVHRELWPPRGLAPMPREVKR